MPQDNHLMKLKVGIYFVLWCQLHDLNFQKVIVERRGTQVAIFGEMKNSNNGLQFCINTAIPISVGIKRYDALVYDKEGYNFYFKIGFSRVIKCN